MRILRAIAAAAIVSLAAVAVSLWLWVRSDVARVMRPAERPRRLNSRFRGLNSTQTFPAEDAPERVSPQPDRDSRQVAPGVFVRTLKAAKSTAARLEDDTDFLFIESIYDESGRQVATSVPSTRWSLLSTEQRLGLVGMRDGEHRIIWRCSSSKSSCEIEDVQAFALPGQPPLILRAAPDVDPRRACRKSYHSNRAGPRR